MPMSELTNNSYSRLQDSLERLEGKTKGLLDAVAQSHKERSALETKIEDAQARIQNILNKLPSQSDSGQLDLLASAQKDEQ
jgi:predicted  nucleic acid-binding Zn-ribbon protein